MEILLTLTWFLLLAWLMPRMALFRAEGVRPRVWQGLFLLKVMAGVILWAIYTWYYTDRTTADIHRYFEDARVLYSALPEHPDHFFRMLSGIFSDSPDLTPYYDTMNNWYKNFNHNLYNDNRTIIRFNALAMLFSFGHYHVHNVIMNFAALCGLTALFRVALPYFNGKKRGLLAIIFLMPSVLFWGSGVLKEGIVLFATGMLVLYADRWIRRPHSVVPGLMMALMTGLLLLSKVYVLLALIPGLVAYATAFRAGMKKTIWIHLAVHALMIAAMANIGRWVPEYDLVVTIQGKQDDFLHMLEEEKAGSRIDLPVLEPRFSSLLLHSPRALSQVFFRPFPWEANSPFMLLAAAENIAVLFLFIMALLFFRRPDARRLNLALFCLSFTLLLFALIGLVTPVMGAIVRYKIPALPFLGMFFLLIIDHRKLLARFHFLHFLNRL